MITWHVPKASGGKLTGVNSGASTSGVIPQASSYKHVYVICLTADIHVRCDVGAATAVATDEFLPAGVGRWIPKETAENYIAAISEAGSGHDVFFHVGQPEGV
jgi:hypothetical protein